MYYRGHFPTRVAARLAVVEFIEAYCNRRKPHSTISYKMPTEAMAAFFGRSEPRSELIPMAA